MWVGGQGLHGFNRENGRFVGDDSGATGLSGTIENLAGGMSAAEAASIGETISENPWISASVMADFHKKLLEKPPTDVR